MKKPLYPSLREQIANKCIHFNGIINKTCEAGIRYDLFRQQWDETCKGFPCLRDTKTPLTCDKREWPSEEQIQARLDEIEASSERHRKAGAIVNEFRARHKGESAQEEVSCPACRTGTLYLSIAGSNGHVWGKCSTPNCLAWME